MHNKSSKQATLSNTDMYINSVSSAALTINSIHDNKLDVNELVKILIEQTSKIVFDGDITSLESILATQARTLSVLFNKMISMAMHTNNLTQIQGLTDVGLKAQKQCRQTLSVLADLKHPNHATFVKQQNIAVNQQVNNPNQEQNFKNLEKSANELLSEVTNAALDTRRTSEAITANLRVEAMEQIKRCSN